MRDHLREIVEDNTTRRGMLFDYVVQILIFLSLLSYAVETLPQIPPSLKLVLHYSEVVFIVLFTFEYLLRIYVANNRWAYIFSFYGVIDLLAVLPFYLGGFKNLTGLRAFRVFRIFGALKLVRYNKAIHRFKIATGLVKEEIFLFLLVTAIFIFLSSVGIYYFEHEAQPDAFASIFHSAWWAVVTLTTVGYGDIYPITLGGKMFTFVILIIGVAIVTVPAGLVATALSRAREIEMQEKHDPSKKQQ